MKITKSLLSNAVANYLGVAYTTLVGMVVFPMYLQYLGPEAFGLVGFFTVLQAWMQLLDLGMSPMLSRQVAHARGVDVGYLELQKLLRSLEVIFFAFSLIVMLSVALRSTWIASNWLNIESLDLQKVANCIVFMGGAIGLRLFASLYRSGIRGAENQVWLNIANVMLATFKTMGALLLLKYITQEFVHFFIFQLFIAVAELITLAAMFYSSMPFSGRVGISFHWGVLKPTLPFCGGVAYTAAIWVLLTQLDKLLLSSILPLSEYGYFTLVAVVAAGIVTLSGPISQAILPRMTYLLSRGEEKKMLALYRKATQFMAVIMFPLTGMVALFSNELLYAWTGDRKAAEWAGPILFWFALGNGILVVGAFQYYLQFAHGKLRMHVIYNTVSACVQIPVVVWAAFAYGAFGTAVAWFVLRLVAFLIWSPIVHSKFAPGIYWPWLLKDIAPFLFCTVALLTVISKIGVDFGGMGRAAVLVSFGGIGLIVLALNVVVSGACRDTIVSIFRKKRISMSDRAQETIMRDWVALDCPVASVCCLTYNHKKYIRKAIDSFLMQDTNFPFEIVVHDDASTDGTRDIVLEYAKRYPRIIKLVLQTENQYRKGGLIGVRLVFPKTKGRYVALCEGDDYWTDSRKLQKQVDFLDAHSEYVITYTDSQPFDEHGYVDVNFGGAVRDVSAMELVRGIPLYTLTTCFRNVIKELPFDLLSARLGDQVIWSLLGAHGKGKYLSDISPAAYRVHDGGVHSKKSQLEKIEMSLLTSNALLSYYSRLKDEPNARYFAEYSFRLSRRLIGWKRLSVLLLQGLFVGFSR